MRLQREVQWSYNLLVTPTVTVGDGTNVQYEETEATVY